LVTLGLFISVGHIAHTLFDKWRKSKKLKEMVEDFGEKHDLVSLSCPID